MNLNKKVLTIIGITIFILAAGFSFQVYKTARIHFKTQWVFTRLQICGHNTQKDYVCSIQKTNGTFKDLTWWLRPGPEPYRIYVAALLKDYGWRYCQLGVSLAPPYKDGWVTITYNGNGKCSIQNGYK